MSTLDIALSGLTAASARLNVSAQNVANSQTDGPLPNVQPNSTVPLPAGSALPKVYAPLQLVQFSLPLSQGGGVETSTRTSSSPYLTAYAPNSPYADSTGQVATPNVDPITETVNQIEAVTQFKANLNVLKAGDEMLRAALKLTV